MGRCECAPVNHVSIHPEHAHVFIDGPLIVSYRTLRDGSLVCRAPGISCQSTFTPSLRDNSRAFAFTVLGVDADAGVN